jgi:hypothetical protein
MNLYDKRLRMHTGPNTTSGLCRADDHLPLQRLDLRTGSVEEELDLLLDTVDFKAAETDGFVHVVH